ncbi:hypothetical protein ACFE04_014501 [Oxalis oulophora]
MDTITALAFPNPNPNYIQYQDYINNYHHNQWEHQQQQQQLSPPKQIGATAAATATATTLSARRRQPSLREVHEIVLKIQREFVEAGEHVSAWRVVKSLLSYLKVESRESLGFAMQEVDSLNRIMSTEARFIEKRENKQIKTDEFLDFVAEKKNANGKEELHIRIQTLGMHISFISEAKRMYEEPLKKYLKRSTKDLKRPLFSTRKQAAHPDFCGKYIRYASSSSQGEESEPESPTQNFNSGSNRVSSCPYPSLKEEISRLGLDDQNDGQTSSASGGQNVKSGSLKKKRNRQSLSNSDTVPTKTLKKEKIEQYVPSVEKDSDKKVGNCNLNENKVTLSDNSIRAFITTWKEACMQQSVAEYIPGTQPFRNCVGLFNIP